MGDPYRDLLLALKPDHASDDPMEEVFDYKSPDTYGFTENRILEDIAIGDRERAEHKIAIDASVRRISELWKEHSRVHSYGVSSSTGVPLSILVSQANLDDGFRALAKVLRLLLTSVENGLDVGNVMALWRCLLTRCAYKSVFRGFIDEGMGTLTGYMARKKLELETNIRKLKNLSSEETKEMDESVYKIIVCGAILHRFDPRSSLDTAILLEKTIPAEANPRKESGVLNGKPKRFKEDEITIVPREVSPRQPIDWSTHGRDTVFTEEGPVKIVCEDLGSMVSQPTIEVGTVSRILDAFPPFPKDPFAATETCCNLWYRIYVRIWSAIRWPIYRLSEPPWERDGKAGVVPRQFLRFGSELVPVTIRAMKRRQFPFVVLPPQLSRWNVPVFSRIGTGTQCAVVVPRTATEMSEVYSPEFARCEQWARDHFEEFVQSGMKDPFSIPYTIVAMRALFDNKFLVNDPQTGKKQVETRFGLLHDIGTESAAISLQRVLEVSNHQRVVFHNVVCRICGNYSEVSILHDIPQWLTNVTEDDVFTAYCVTKFHCPPVPGNDNQQIVGDDTDRLTMPEWYKQ